MVEVLRLSTASADGHDAEVTVDAVSHYLSLMKSGIFLDDMCLTWSHGKSPEEVAHLLGGDTATAAPRTVGQAIDDATALDDSDDGVSPLVAVVGALGDWVMAVEPYGGQGTRPVVLRALSAGGGRALSVKWNVNLDNQLAYAADGRLLARFDMLRKNDPSNVISDAARSHLHDLALWQEAESIESGLAVAEGLSGHRLEKAWFRRRHIRVFITTPLNSYLNPNPTIPEEVIGHPALDEPEIAVILAKPVSSKLPAVAAMAARLARTEPSLAEVSWNPIVDAAIQALVDRPSTAECQAIRAELLTLADDLSIQGRALQDTSPADPLPATAQLNRQSDVVRAIAAAFEPNPLEAALNALRIAKQLPLDADAHLRLDTLQKYAEYIQRHFPIGMTFPAVW
ncbi:hypothetical protein J5X84_25745 [Streptosporangiaceae bacterium NEAU-GS5]|nr:hypothetical protein [Streptosporangiaceae bacterium NEAU-GS5]